MADGKKPRAAEGASAPRLLFRDRTGGGGGQQSAADRGRAHQRDRLAAVQEHGRRREVGRGDRNRALAGQERRAHRRCLPADRTDRDEIKDIPLFYEKLIRKIKAPIMIDTTDPKAVELSLTYCQGKSIINSINLEDGEEKFERICPLAKAYGAALVVGCIDEDKLQAQAFTRERKLAVAERSVQLLTEKYGIPPEDIIIDPLVFPCATGDANYIGGAVETIEAHPADQGEDSVRQDGAGHFEHLVRPAGVGARSGQLGLPLLLHQGGPRSGDRERGKAGALRLDSGAGAAPGGEPAVQHAARRGRGGTAHGAGRLARADRRAEGRDQSVPHRRHRRVLPQGGQEGQSQGRRSAARPAPGELHHRRHQGRPDRRSGSQAERGRRRSISSTVR